ncbi:TrbC/VirB2 family protein [Salinicola sp. NYA28a]
MRAIEHKSLAFVAALMAFFATSPAFAQVSTAESSFANLEDWLMQWIPAAATVIIIVCALVWMIGWLPMVWAGRIVIGCIIIGSVSAILGFFGLS